MDLHRQDMGAWRKVGGVQREVDEALLVFFANRDDGIGCVGDVAIRQIGTRDFAAIEVDHRAVIAHQRQGHRGEAAVGWHREGQAEIRRAWAVLGVAAGVDGGADPGIAKAEWRRTTFPRIVGKCWSAPRAGEIDARVVITPLGSTADEIHRGGQ